MLARESLKFHILTRETRYFRDWALLAVYLTSKLDAPGSEDSQKLVSAG